MATIIKFPIALLLLSGPLKAQDLPPFFDYATCIEELSNASESHGLFLLADQRADDLLLNMNPPPDVPSYTAKQAAKEAATKAIGQYVAALGGICETMRTKG